MIEKQKGLEENKGFILERLGTWKLVPVLLRSGQKADRLISIPNLRFLLEGFLIKNRNKAKIKLYFFGNYDFRIKINPRK